MKKKLGKIEEIDLREIFKDEARDLTPWLAREENLQVLSSEIGINIRFLETEASVGRFNVDILAEEESTGRKVIIENQLQVTDHDHLGKLITYGSGHDVSVVIWIFKEIRDEHRRAIEWLNEHIDETINFFAIKLQLWKIDESKPAPKFELIASPNEWAKTIRNKDSQGITDTRLRQLEFWTKLKGWIQSRDKQMRLQAPRPQHWYTVSIGSSDAHIALTVNTRENQVACEIYISRNRELFNFLHEQKDQIHSEFKTELEWIEASKASRIKLPRKDVDIQNVDMEEEYFCWIYENITLFKKVFSKYINQFKNDTDEPSE